MRHWLSVLVLFGSAAALLPQQPPKPRFEIKGTVRPDAPAPAPRPGDKIAIEGGAVLFEYESAEGRLVRRQLELVTQVEPEVTVAFQLARPGIVRYSYGLKNGRGARQGIALFAVAMDAPDVLSGIQTPAGWHVSGHSLARWGTPSRFNWSSDDYRQGLAPGASAGPFAFDSPCLPGLTRLYIQGVQPEQIVGMHEIPSEWLAEQLFEALRFENNSVKPLTVGPKIDLRAAPATSHVLEAVRTELLSVVGTREFRGLDEAILSLVQGLPSADRAALTSLRSTMDRIGTTPLQKDFFNAMALNLDYAIAMH